ncbi:helix-turn-helix transcriptional regulator [Clostridium botulinum]|nr:helix-turn-helix transcriptional regulator [Clostridium botulinum]NFN47913.1 helix-turn-helix transcriptional regulator [Clostridium botulinum]
MGIGANIKNAREKKGFSRKQLADELNVTDVTISRYENEKREPKRDTLVKIANFLDVSLLDLIYDDNVKVEEERIKKIKNELSENEKKLINYSPSMANYMDSSFKAIDILKEYLKLPSVQEDCNYNYNELMLMIDIDNLHIFIEDMLRMKIAEIKSRKNE